MQMVWVAPSVLRVHTELHLLALVSLAPVALLAPSVRCARVGLPCNPLLGSGETTPRMLGRGLHSTSVLVENQLVPMMEWRVKGVVQGTTKVLLCA